MFLKTVFPVFCFRIIAFAFFEQVTLIPIPVVLKAKVRFQTSRSSLTITAIKILPIMEPTETKTVDFLRNIPLFGVLSKAELEQLSDMV